MTIRKECNACKNIIDEDILDNVTVRMTYHYATDLDLGDSEVELHYHLACAPKRLVEVWGTRKNLGD
jgi:hypothetical protein